MSENDFHWESLSARILEEVNNRNTGDRARANDVTQVCCICGKSNHSLDRCFFNPRNRRNKLNLKSEDSDSDNE